MIINGTKNPEQILREYFEREAAARRRAADDEKRRRRNDGAGGGVGAGAGNPPPPPPPPTGTVASPTIDHLILRDLRCVDADGTVFEQYPELHLARDVVRNGTSHRSFTPYQAISYFEQQQPAGLFLPSVALSCNIVAALFTLAVEKQADGSYKTKDATAKLLLDHYKDHGAGYGWHAQNSVIDYGRRMIIHYPCDADFPVHGGTTNINASRQRIGLPFEKIKRKGPLARDELLRTITLEDGLKQGLVTPFVRQYTGLVDPSIMVEIGQYFQRPTKVWFPTNPANAEDCTETRAAWLGCGTFDFNLSANYNLNYFNAARGVRR